MRSATFLFVLLILLHFVAQSPGLNADGVLLLAFKNSILRDPLLVLENWNYNDQTPCSWRGVFCEITEARVFSRVVGLSLPSSQLLGSIPPDLGAIEHLQRLDLSNNTLNGSLPFSLFNNSEIRYLDLSNNVISGELPAVLSLVSSNLQSLNLSDNALAGKLPANLGSLTSLNSLSLKNNYFSGVLSSGFRTVEVLDLSSNLINGSLRSDFGGDSLRYFNASYNRLSGTIPPEFGEKIPADAVVDVSFNDLAGPVPESPVFANQKPTSFSGNRDLCGEATTKPCSTIPPPSFPPSPTSPPAIAAIPRTINSPVSLTPESSGPKDEKQNGLKPATIVGIVAGDIVGVGILAMIFLYIYKLKKKNKKKIETTLKNEANMAKLEDWSSSSSTESRGFTRWSCLRKRAEDEQSSSSDDTAGSENDEEVGDQYNNNKGGQENQRFRQGEQRKGGTLVTVDGGEKELELETLLKASAYILGATGSSIMYKAVLEDGTTLAVRRIGENSLDRFKDFENQVRVVAKLVHPNLVRVRGFYWGADEKLIIYDFVPNGSLANARYKKVGSSPCHLPWEARLKIAKGVACGLAYLHEKKHVHGNLKPSNILLGSDMEPKIGDFGLERLVTSESSYKFWGSARNFGSKRTTASRDSFPDFSLGPTPSPSPSPSAFSISPYHAPESLRSLKPNPKWDVFSFGVILLELLTGKVVILDESGQGPGIVVDDKNRALRMADMVIRADLEGKEEALLACFKVGYNCASPVPQKRPSMKDVLQVLEKFPSTPPSSRYC